MIIKLTPSQVPTYWEIIKYSLVHGDLVKDDNRQVVLNETLHALLNEKAQCFFRLAEDRQVIAAMLTRLQISKASDEKYLFIQCIFSFRKVKNMEWQEDWNYLNQFAINEECKYIKAESANPEIFKILNSIAFKESFRTFVHKL